MAAEAARAAMAKAGVEPGEIDILILSTATPDRWLPSTACDLQALWGQKCYGLRRGRRLHRVALCAVHGRGVSWRQGGERSPWSWAPRR